MTHEAPNVKDLTEPYALEHLPGRPSSPRKTTGAIIKNDIFPVSQDRKVAGVNFGDIRRFPKK